MENLKNKMSAKDTAFEKERVKYRRVIRDLEHKLKEKQELILDMKISISEKDDTIAQKDDWIQRLLSFAELSEDDMKSMIESEKAKNKLVDGLSNLAPLLGFIDSLYKI